MKTRTDTIVMAGRDTRHHEPVFVLVMISSLRYWHSHINVGLFFELLATLIAQSLKMIINVHRYVERCSFPGYDSAVGRRRGSDANRQISLLL